MRGKEGLAYYLNQAVLQLYRVEWFSEIIARAELSEMQFFFMVVFSTADDDDRDVGEQAAAPEMGEQLRTIDVGHTRTSHNHIGEKTLTEPAQGFEAVFGPYHIKLFGKKSPDEKS